MATTVARGALCFDNDGGGHHRALGARRVAAADGGTEQTRARGAAMVDL